MEPLSYRCFTLKGPGQEAIGIKKKSALGSRSNVCAFMRVTYRPGIEYARTLTLFQLLAEIKRERSRDGYSVLTYREGSGRQCFL